MSDGAAAPGGGGRGEPEETESSELRGHRSFFVCGRCWAGGGRLGAARPALANDRSVVKFSAN